MRREVGGWETWRKTGVGCGECEVLFGTIGDNGNDVRWGRTGVGRGECEVLFGAICGQWE